MTKGEFYELMAQIDIDAAEYAKDKGEFKHICETAYSLGAMKMLQKICKI